MAFIQTVQTVVFTVVFGLFGLILLMSRVIAHPLSFHKKKTRSVPPACLSDPFLGTHEYVTVNGVKFHCVSNGDPDKPLLLFVHGFFEFWYSWRYQLKYFSTDYRVMAIDIKGYGESDKPAGKENYNFDVFEQDFVELVKAVSPNKKCTLIAHDGGGILCWRVAEHHPELFHKCILTNVPHPRAYKRLLSKSWKQLFASWYAFMFQFPWLPELLFSINDYEVLHLLQKRLENFSEEDLEAYKYTYSRKGALSPMFDYYRSMFTKGSKKPFKTVEIPTLCLWTENHSAFDMSIVHGYDDICTDLTIKMIPDSSSFLQQYCPDVVNNYIKEFLQQ